MAITRNSDESTSSKQQPLLPLTSGMPPWHTTAFVALLAAVTIQNLPSLQSLDEMASLQTFTHRVFPELLSLRTLAVIRLSIAAVALSLTIWLIMGEGWNVYANYKPQSKLRREFIKLRGLGTLCPFTSWCWCFLGLSFLFNGSIALAVDQGRVDLIKPWMLRSAIVLSELAFPFALLVSTAVKYAIWPAVLAGGRPHNLAGFRNQMQHNLNSVFALSEVALLGGINLNFRHLPLATFVGIVYILFTWVMAVLYYGDRHTTGPQYLYWFQDTTLGKTTTLAMLALLIALTMFFGIFAGIEMLIEAVGESLPTKLTLVVAFSAFVCRFR
jgi:hypothetical protein